jgi:hypothetical protein
VPVDPFTGEALKMTRSEDGVVTIYSVGPDMKDDGGTPMDTTYRRGSIEYPVPGDITLTLGGGK